jgi:hypothetical protein
MVAVPGEGYALLQGAHQDGYASNQYGYDGWTKNFGALAATHRGAVTQRSGVIGTFHWVLDVSGYFVGE